MNSMEAKRVMNGKYADLYIDDSALGCPLTTSATCSRPYVDWVRVREWLVKEGFL